MSTLSGPSLPRGAAVLVDSSGELGEQGETVGASVWRAPSNRYEDYLVTTLADAVPIVGEVASPAVEAIADTFPVSIEKTDIRSALVEAGPRSTKARSATPTDCNRATGTTTGMRLWTH